MPTHNDVLFWDREYAHVNWADGIDLSWIRPEIPEGSLVLDAGCGNGRYLKELCRHFSCVGMDISSEGIRRAADRISAGKETGQARPELLTGSVTCIPFADNSFDAVVSCSVFQHLGLADRKKASSEICRVLSGGGLFFFESFGSDDMRRGGTAFQNSEGRPEENTYVRNSGIIYHYFTEEEIRELFPDAGFEIVKLIHVRRSRNFSGGTYVRHHIRCLLRKRQPENL